MTKESVYKRTNNGTSSGLNKGFIVTKRARVVRPVESKGKLSERVKLIRSVVREVSGWAPYERRIMEILRGGGNNPGKRAWRFAKRRLGTHVRAKRKVSEMGEVIASIRRTEAAEGKTTKR